MTKPIFYRHVHGSLNADQSPVRRNGFQTIRRHPNLSSEEDDEITSRLAFLPRDGAGIRRLFFRLSTGRVVFTEMHGVRDVDHSGRTGLFVADSLVCDAGDLTDHGISPFNVFDQRPFVSTMEQALTRAGDVVQLDDTKTDQSLRGLISATPWQLQQIVTLSRYAMAAAELGEKRKTLAIVGSPADVEDTLRLIFACIPVVSQVNCSFATLHDGCQTHGTPLWAMGLERRPVGPSYVTADVNRREIEVTEAKSHPSYAMALGSVLEGAEYETIEHVSKKKALDVLCAFADGNNVSINELKAAPDDCVALVASKVPRFASRLVGLLSQHMPNTLAVRAVRVIPSVYGLRPAAVSLATRQWTADMTAELLERMYRLENFRAPAANEIEAVGEVVRGRRPRLLSIIWGLWMGYEDWVQQCLCAVSDREYATIIRLLLEHQLTPPTNLIVAGSRREKDLERALCEIGYPVNAHLLELVDAFMAARQKSASRGGRKRTGLFRWFSQEKGR